MAPPHCLRQYIGVPPSPATRLESFCTFCRSSLRSESNKSESKYATKYNSTELVLNHEAAADLHTVEEHHEICAACCILRHSLWKVDPNHGAPSDGLVGGVRHQKRPVGNIPVD